VETKLSVGDQFVRDILGLLKYRKYLVEDSGEPDDADRELVEEREDNVMADADLKENIARKLWNLRNMQQNSVR